MSIKITRSQRRPAAVVAAAGIMVGLAACGGSEDSVVLASYQKGFSAVLTEDVKERVQNNDAFAVEDYSDVQQLYTDMLSGKVQMSIGGPDVYAKQAANGAPIHIAATVSPNSTAVVGKQEITSAEDLKGARVAAITTTGGWALASAAISDDFGLEAGEDYEIINVQDMASGASQVLAGTADYVVGWEPSVNAALRQSDDLMISYSVAGAAPGETYGAGWQLVLAVRDDVPQDQVNEAITILQESAETLSADPDLADKYAVGLGFSEGTAASVMGQSVKAFVVEPLTEESMAEIAEQIETVSTAGGTPIEIPEGFLGKDDG